MNDNSKQDIDQMNIDQSNHQPNNQQPNNEHNLNRLSHVSRITAVTYGPLIEQCIMSTMTYCKMYLKDQLKKLNTNLQRAAFGEEINGIPSDEALGYLTSRIDEITEYINKFEAMSNVRHFNHEQTNLINMVYPMIYNECLETAENSTNNVSPSNTDTSYLGNEENEEDEESDEVDNNETNNNEVNNNEVNNNEVDNNEVNNETNNNVMNNQPNNPPRNNPPRNNPPRNNPPHNNPYNIRRIEPVFNFNAEGTGGTITYDFFGNNNQNTFNDLLNLLNGRINQNNQNPLQALFGNLQDDVQVPLKASIIDQMPSMVFNESTKNESTKNESTKNESTKNESIEKTICPICLDNIEDGEKVRYTQLCCKKYLHQSCAYTWWDTKHTCGSCGTNLHIQNDAENENKRSRRNE